MAILKMTKVTYEDNNQIIINNVSHFIEQSSVTAFLGKPGSGKSTALKLLAGLIPPSSGTVTFEDKDIHSMSTDYMRPPLCPAKRWCMEPCQWLQSGSFP